MSLVECELARVVMSEGHDHQVVVLKEKGGERVVPIAIGLFEVWAIHRFINNEPPPRPMTHELFGNVLDALGAKIERIVVTELREVVYIGLLVLRMDGKLYEVDSRPSDAIALAVSKRAPIFVEEAVLSEADQDV
jgi:bifunctional DNase/RNase